MLRLQRFISRRCGYAHIRGAALTASAISMQADLGPQGMEAKAREIMEFWYEEDFETWPRDRVTFALLKKWFEKNDDLDQQIREKFTDAVSSMRDGELDHWQSSTYSCLAGIVLMDQFTRNIYRGTRDMYCLDEKARVWASSLAQSGTFADMNPSFKMTVALPFMHSENLEDQERCIKICNEEVAALQSMEGDDSDAVKIMQQTVDFAKRHRDIIAKYGRFPHRNALLGRQSTKAEEQGLADGSIESF